jgi:hypothetical protein
MSPRNWLFLVPVLIFFLALAGLPARAANILCQVDPTAMYARKGGDLLILATTDTGAQRTWILCNLLSDGPVIPARLCSVFYTQTLTARALGAPLRLVLETGPLGDAVAATGVSWDGTCDGINHWTVLEPALRRVDVL